MPPSKAQIFKIAKLRANAPLELPKARLCAGVVLAALVGPEEVQLAVSRLKEGVGANWAETTAFQFMSGMRGEFAADCGLPDELEQLRLAHKIAEHVCSQEQFRLITAINLAKVKAAIFAKFNELPEISN